MSAAPGEPSRVATPSPPPSRPFTPVSADAQRPRSGSKNGHGNVGDLWVHGTALRPWAACLTSVFASPGSRMVMARTRIGFLRWNVSTHPHPPPCQLHHLLRRRPRRRLPLEYRQDRRQLPESRPLPHRVHLLPVPLRRLPYLPSTMKSSSIYALRSMRRSEQLRHSSRTKFLWSSLCSDCSRSNPVRELNLYVIRNITK